MAGGGARVPGFDVGEVPEDIFQCFGKAAGRRMLADQVDEKAVCGTWIGRYHVIEMIGSGGFGVVYRAEQRQPLHREVALKLIRRSVESHEVVDRFEEERQTLARLQHPSIVGVLDAGTTEEGSPYFVMELVRGEPVTRYCDARRLSLGARVALFQQICGAVHYAHQKAVLHRDLKPSNIIITEIDGQPVPKIIDFGMAQVLAPDAAVKGVGQDEAPATMGTPSYMSPEQLAGSQDLDIRSDIYALGAVLHELLVGVKPGTPESGARPGPGQEGDALLRTTTGRPSLALLSLEARRAGLVAADRCTRLGPLIWRLRGDLDWVVLRAMARERESRYPSAESFADDLDRWRNRQPLRAHPGGAGYQARKFLRRYGWGVAAVAVLLVVMALGVAASLVQARRADVARLEMDGARRQAEAALVEARAQEKLAEAAQGEATRAQGVAEAALGRVNGLLEKSWLETGRAWLERARIFQEKGQPQAALLSAARAVGFAGWGRRAEEPRAIEESFPPLLGRGFATDVALEGERQALALEAEGVIDAVRPSLWPLWSSGQAEPSLGGIHRITWHAAGATLAAVNARGQLRFWEVRADREVFDVVAPYAAPLHDAAFSGDGSLLAAGAADGALVLWRWGQGGQRCLRMREPAALHRLAVSPDGGLVLAAYDNKTVCLWNTLTGEPVWPAPLAVAAPVAELAFSARGRRMALALKNGAMTVWTLPEEGPTPEPLHGQSPAGIMSMALDPAGTLMALGGADGSVHLYDLGLKRFRESFQGQHVDSVEGVVFSGDGQRLFSGGWDHTVRQWSVATGQETGPPVVYESRIHAMAATPDGLGWVAGTRNAVLHLHEGQALSETRRVTFRSAGVSALALSPDGTQLVVGTREQAIEVWELATGVRRATLVGHGGHISDLAFSPDGTLLASASWDGSVRLWETAGWSPVAVLGGGGEFMEDVDFQANGTLLVTAGSSGRLACWDVASRQLRRSLLVSDRGLRAVALQPQGKQVMVVTQEGRLLIQEGEEGPWRTISDDPGFRVTAAAFSGEGRLLAAVSPGGLVRIWHVESLALRQSMDAAMLLNRVLFAPKTGALILGSNDGHVQWWKKGEGDQFRRAAFVTAQSEALSGLACSSDGRVLATAAFDGVIRLWDASSGSEALSLPVPQGRARALAMSADGRCLAVALADFHGQGSLGLWDSLTGKGLATLPGHAGPAQAVAFSPDGRWLASGGADGSLMLWNAQTGARVRSLEPAGQPINDVAFSPDGALLASGSGDGRVRIWEVGSGSPTPQITWQHPVLVSSVVFSRDRRSVLTGSIDGQIIRWNLDPASAPEVLARLGSSVKVLRMSPEGSVLASLTEDGNVQLWEGKGFTLRGVLPTPCQEDGCLAFSPDGRCLALRDEAFGIKIIEIATGATLGRLRGHHDVVSGVAFSPDGSSVATSSWDGGLKMWDAPGRQGGRIAQGPDLLHLFRAGLVKESGGTLQWLTQPGEPPQELRPVGLPSAALPRLASESVSPEEAFGVKMKALARTDQWQAAQGLWNRFQALHPGTSPPEEARSAYLTLLYTSRRDAAAGQDPALDARLAMAIDQAISGHGQATLPPGLVPPTDSGGR